MNPVVAGDVAGAQTLEIMASAPRYNAWQYETIAPYIGSRVLEVGSGIGNMSLHLVESGRELVVLTDTDEWYRDQLRTRFGVHSNVAVAPLTLPDDHAARVFARHRLDTVVALNVVEHIPDDVGALRTMGTMVERGGRVVVLVPALEALFGSLDRELEHQRRYTRRTLRAAAEAAGLRVEALFWFNFVGTFGWWWNARVRRTPRIPTDQLRTFDALVPLLRLERYLPLPCAQSLVLVGVSDA
ncbi:MAG TPA: class I SAM-dependent methyltransferase [Gemmatimonadales bacterium]|jgi:SAM-dependent methyltransferase|nr:class I SAM-dependent methyltransferase [Gemmatimonadales bacterium]